MDKAGKYGKWHASLWRYVPLILWICVIFYLSSGSASMEKTSKLFRPFLKLFLASENSIHLANIIIRKFAHLSCYTILAGFAIFAFKESIRKTFRRNWFPVSFGVVLLIASIDEISQSLNPTRTGSIIDVLLDCLGGMIILLIVRFFYSKAENNR